MEGVFLFAIVATFIAVPISFFSAIFLFFMSKINNFTFERSFRVWAIASALAFLSPMLGIFIAGYANQKLQMNTDWTFLFFMVAPFVFVPIFLGSVHFYFKKREA